MVKKLPYLLQGPQLWFGKRTGESFLLDKPSSEKTAGKKVNNIFFQT
jgi:hypothetical protein